MAVITIGVPVYNTGKYLKECLESIVNQTIFSELEVILIDDNSSDESPRIIRKYLSAYSNISAFRNKQNLGSSASRNIVLRNSSAEYVYFLDGDDLLASKDCIEKLLGSNYMENELIIGKMLRWFPENNVFEEGYHSTYQWSSEFTKKTILDVPVFFRHVCSTNMLIKMSFLRKFNLAYTESIRKFEDDLFTFKMQSLSNAMAFRSVDCYLHRQHSLSKMNVSVTNDYQDSLLLLKEACEFIQSHLFIPDAYARFFLDAQFNRLKKFLKGNL